MMNRSKKLNLPNLKFLIQLIIAIGGSQTFILDKGMSGGYDDINVVVRYGPAGSIWTSSKKVNFNNGETTTVTLKGCNSYQGCNGYRLD